MQTINVRETRERLASLLDAVEAGDEVVILRHGQPAARLTSVQPEPVRFPDRSALRSSIPPARDPAAEVTRRLRDTERY